MHRSLLAVALAEMRSSRRLVRTWLFFFLAAVMGLGSYAYYGVVHAFGSGHLVTTGMIASPKVLSVQLAGAMLLVLQVCLVFLAFDVLARDRRDGIHEVLSSRPVSNLELLVGRTLGLTVLAWIPVLAFAVLVLVMGAVGAEMGWWTGEAEPVSFAAMALVDVPVSLVQWCVLIILLAVVLRYRLIVAIAALALAGLSSWAAMITPLYLIPIFGFGPNLLPSDMMPVFLDGTAFAQRLSSLAISAGLLVVAAALYPRLDGASKAIRLATGAALVGIGAAGLTGIVISAKGDLTVRDNWASVHRPLAGLARANVEHVDGRVVIEPGEFLRIDVDMRLQPPPAASGELLMSFNPGMEIETLRLNGEEVAYSHASGLLTVHPTSVPSGPVTLSLVATGVPDARFAYLDSAVNPHTVTGTDYSVAQLGLEASLFDDDYVALMPGTRWLPLPGPNFGDEAPFRGRDFFTADIEVQAPSGWTVAGPGERRAVEGSDLVRFRPGAPVPAIALLTAPFERRAIGAGGVLFELLIHPAHGENLDFFADATDELTLRLEELFDEAAEVGLPYPYDALTVVEIPSRLRGYGGGWRLDTVLAQPGMLLLREFSLPIARFDLIDTEELEDDREGGIAAVKIDMLARSLENDFAGGNVFPGAARNFLRFQTGAAGPGAAAIDFVLDSLANRVVTDRPGHFSAYRISADFQYAAGAAMANIFGGRVQSATSAAYRAATSRPSVWDRALSQPLSQLDVDKDPEKALNALMLKATSIADVTYDALGPIRAAALLAELRERYTGQNFTAEDLENTAADLGIDLGGLLGGWLDETHLPGFLTSEARVRRLSDDDDGSPRYQVLVDVRNDEPAPGLFRMVYSTEEQTVKTEEERYTTDPIRIAADASVEVGMVTNSPPDQLQLQPYLSLNRRNVRVSLPEVDATEALDIEPLDGARPSDWRPPAPAGVIVDDLDPGFIVESDSRDDHSSGFLAAMAGVDAEMDEGLLLYSPPFHTGGQDWVRQVMPAHWGKVWGKYRRTTTRATGSGTARAIFAATLPAAGTWRLDYHMPISPKKEVVFLGRQGQYDIKLVVGKREQPVEFDASIAEQGWNNLGDFEIESRDVRLVVSNLASPGFVIYADAIRWTPVTTE